MKQIECIVPILRVADVSLSADYYVHALGFKIDWQHRDSGYAILGVSRDDCPIYLCEGDQGNPGTWVWIGVEDVDQLYDEYSESGAIISKTPTDYPWAREMHVSDLDGHVLRIGSDSKSGES
jgi:predicted lactoylglutathione lyase